MTDQELREQFARTDAAIERTTANIDRLSIRMDSLASQAERTERQLEKLIKTVANQSKEIGGVSNKFGTFTEGLLDRPLEFVLRENLGCKEVWRVSRRKNSLLKMEAEIDMLGFTNGSVNRVVAVEIKSQLRLEYLDQMERIIEKFPVLYPGFRGYTLECMFAAISSSEELDQLVSERGFHLAKTSNYMYELADPPNFAPRQIKV